MPHLLSRCRSVPASTASRATRSLTVVSPVSEASSSLSRRPPTDCYARARSSSPFELLALLCRPNRHQRQASRLSAEPLPSPPTTSRIAAYTWSLMSHSIKSRGTCERNFLSKAQSAQTSQHRNESSRPSLSRPEGGSVRLVSYGVAQRSSLCMYHAGARSQGAMMLGNAPLSSPPIVAYRRLACIQRRIFIFTHRHHLHLIHFPDHC